jgi:Protein of unknown function (DUF1616)
MELFMRRGNLDLLTAALPAAVSAAVVVFVPDQPVRTVFALPLLFVLPGLSLTAALFPGNRLDFARRLLLQLGLSLTSAILGALVLDLTVGLRRSSWATLLAAVTCIAAAIAGLRQRGRARGALSRCLPRPVNAVLVGMAVAVVAAAVALARTPLAAKNVVGYTALSILPARGSSSAASEVVRVEVTSGELQPLKYRLELYVGSGLVDVRQLTLAPGQDWQASFRLRLKSTGGRPWIRALLYRAGLPHTVYRSARIRAGEA